MYLVVYIGGQTFYLDVRCGHCKSGNGQVNREGTMAQVALRKHERYRTVVGGVRVTCAKLVPIALSSLGGVGKEARGFFGMLRVNTAEEDGEGFGLRGSRRLVSLCSFLSAMYNAENAMCAYVSPECGPVGRRRVA